MLLLGKHRRTSMFSAKSHAFSPRTKRQKKEVKPLEFSILNSNTNKLYIVGGLRFDHEEIDIRNKKFIGG